VIHYVVSFTVRDDAGEGEQIRRVADFLEDLKGRNRIHDYRVLRSRPAPGARPRFRADVTFVDDTQFGTPFSEVNAIGVHEGRHGLMIEHVNEMSVEVFDEMRGPPPY
jgi:hypothetical protein